MSVTRNRMGMSMSDNPVRRFRQYAGPNDVRVFVTSAQLRVEGSHDRLSIWVNGQLSGELTLTIGDGALLAVQLGLVEAR